MAEPVALAALALDAAIGWPDALYRRIGHPVGAFARIINWCELHWNAPAKSSAHRRLLGAVTLLFVTGFAFGIAWIAVAFVRLWLGDLAWIGLALLAFPGLAQRSLHDHVAPVATALAMRDLPRARAAVSLIVGRDVASLDAAGIARAAIESLAESFCDGIVAPLFWLLLLGVPGLWAYKAINTADSLIGHHEERWRAFGWAAARADDVVNLVPARVAGLVICLVGLGGIATMLRDAGKHASPNAGWPEAAMAGVLGVRLAGPVAYDSVMLEKRWIGSGRSEATAGDLQRALAVYRTACFMLWLIAGGLAWAL